MTRTKETNGEGNTGGDEGDEGHRDVGATTEHRVENCKCLPPRRRGQAGGKTVRRNIGGGQAARSDTEDQGAGLGGTVKGRAAEGATRSNTEDRGAGLGGMVKGRAAEGAMRSDIEEQGAGQGDTVWGRAAGQTAEGAGRSNKKKKKTTRRVREEAKDTSSDSSSGDEMEQEVRRVIQERVWPGTRASARRGNVILIRMDSSDETTSNDESDTEEEQEEEGQANRSSDTKVEQEVNRVIRERVWSGTRASARRGNIILIRMDSSDQTTSNDESDTEDND